MIDRLSKTHEIPQPLHITMINEYMEANRKQMKFELYPWSLSTLPIKTIVCECVKVQDVPMKVNLKLKFP